ncbi:MAG TPA: hypothetical protein EYP16_06555, partial [Candidatus Atribacteria bacterium]|nr:hypothetical protein [Candidatus Atribacteria bacterium]
MSLIALLTDFGYDDEYVGVMKGVVYSEIENAKIVDILHNVEPFNVKGAAIILKGVVNYFPSTTIFVVVVDPGVGTERKSLILFKNKQVFIGPDNGIFSLIMDDRAEIFEIDVPKLSLEQISYTFHGRDIFIRSAIKYIKGEDVKGKSITSPVRLRFP